MNYKLSLYYIFSIYLCLQVGILSFDETYRTKDFFKTIIDWTNGTVSIEVKEKLSRVVVDPRDPNYGKENTSFNISEARSKSIIQAKEKSAIRIVRAVESIRLDDKHTILNKLDSDEVFREMFNNYYLQEPEYLNVRYRKDNVILESKVSLIGNKGVMNYVQIDFNSEKFPVFDVKEYPVLYSGLIIDARHLKATPALLPRIATDAGLEIYSPYLVSKSFAIDKGMVSYQRDPVLAMKSKRVGGNPLFIVALDTFGENNTGYTISTSDAIKLLAHKKSRDNLKMCRVIILLSQQPF